MTNERDWDPDSNGRESGLELEGAYINGADASGAIWIDNGGTGIHWSDAATITNATIHNNHLHSEVNNSVFGNDEVSLASGRIRINRDETRIQRPTEVWPVMVDTHDSPWWFIFLYMISWVFTPWLMIWSKIRGRPAGFRIRQ